MGLAVTALDLERKVFQPGQPLFIEGDTGDCAYLIEDGAVAVLKSTLGGRETLIASLAKGDIVGEMALVDAGVRGASAKATEFTTTAVISRETFELRVHRSNPVVRMLLLSLVKRIREANHSAVNAPSDGWRPVRD